MEVLALGVITLLLGAKHRTRAIKRESNVSLVEPLPLDRRSRQQVLANPPAGRKPSWPILGTYGLLRPSLNWGKFDPRDHSQENPIQAMQPEAWLQHIQW
jgi:hypothetical protein